MKQDSRTIIDISQDRGLSREPIMNVCKTIPGLPNLPKYHWLPSTPDSRDIPYTLLNTSTPLPATVDLRQYASPIDDQGNLGSCTGNAIAGAMDANADWMVTPCPLCHLKLDVQHHNASKAIGRDVQLPVLHMPQMVGLALGCTPGELGLNHHVTKVNFV